MTDHVFEAPKPVWDFNTYARFVPPCGYIRDYLYYAIQCTDAPPLYHILTSTAIVSGAISPHVDLVFQNEIHPLHLFILLVGNSSESRKTSAIKRAVRVATPVFAPLSARGERLWWMAVSSPEGITEELAKEPNRVMLLSEWTELHRMSLAGYWQHSGEHVNLLYDAVDAHRARSRSKTIVIRPRVTILGATTPSLIQDAVVRSDWLAGKMARYIIGPMTRPKDREMETAVDLPDMVNDLRLRLGELTQPNPLLTAGSMSQEAWHIMRAWLRSEWWQDLKARAPEHLIPSFSRVQEHIFRLAAVFEASMSYPSRLEVSPEAMHPALALMEWCYEAMCKTLPNVSDAGTPLSRMTNILASAGSRGMSRAALIRASKLTLRQANEVLATLYECADVVVSIGRDGKSHLVYVPPTDE